MVKDWWQPPQLRIGEDGVTERRATWLELFFDLVFVVAIAQLAHKLNEEISLSGFFGFVALFIPVWWSWVGAAFYANRFDTDDLGHRLLTSVQMLAVAALAVNIHHGLGDSSAGFALSYAAVRFVLVVEYLRAGKHAVAARSLLAQIRARFWDCRHNLVTFSICSYSISVYSLGCGASNRLWHTDICRTVTRPTCPPFFSLARTVRVVHSDCPGRINCGGSKWSCRTTLEPRKCCSGCVQFQHCF